LELLTTAWWYNAWG